jgi:hypothetical protein
VTTRRFGGSKTQNIITSPPVEHRTLSRCLETFNSADIFTKKYWRLSTNINILTLVRAPIIFWRIKGFQTPTQCPMFHRWARYNVLCFRYSVISWFSVTLNRYSVISWFIVTLNRYSVISWFIVTLNRYSVISWFVVTLNGYSVISWFIVTLPRYNWISIQSRQTTI